MVSTVTGTGTPASPSQTRAGYPSLGHSVTGRGKREGVLLATRPLFLDGALELAQHWCHYRWVVNGEETK
jgi:hypothetical protein